MNLAARLRDFQARALQDWEETHKTRPYLGPSAGRILSAVIFWPIGLAVVAIVWLAILRLAGLL